MEGNFGISTTLEQFGINNNTGALTSANTIAGSNDRLGNIVNDPKGQFVFAAYSAPSSNLQAGSLVTLYSIGPNGQLTQADQKALPNRCDTISSLLVDPTGTNLYVSCTYLLTGGSISTYTIDRSSAKLINSSPDVGMANTAMPGKIILHPNGVYLYGSRLTPHHYPGQGGWELYMRNPANGTLTDTGTQFNWTTFPTEYTDAAFAQGGKYLVCTNSGATIDVFTIDPVSGIGSANNRTQVRAWGIISDQSGNYVITDQTDGPVVSYRVNTDGSLTVVGSSMAEATTNTSIPGGEPIAMDHSGRYVYVESLSASRVFGFAFDGVTGALAPIAGSPFATKAQAAAITTAGH